VLKWNGVVPPTTYFSGGFPFGVMPALLLDLARVGPERDARCGSFFIVLACVARLPLLRDPGVRFSERFVGWYTGVRRPPILHLAAAALVSVLALLLVEFTRSAAGPSLGERAPADRAI
jgi:hypothetical protein